MSSSDWVKWSKGFSRKREVVTVAHQLKISRREAATMIFEFWEWCDDNVLETEITAEGDAILPSPVTVSVIDSLTGAPGFSDALILVDWMYSRGGQLCIRKYARHNGKQAKDRAAAQLRMKRSRCASVAQNANSASLYLDSKEDLEKAWKEIPEILRTKEFFDLWKKWVTHRKEIKKPLTKTQVESQLKMLAKNGLERATVMIEHTIEKGWQGLREPDNGRQYSKIRPGSQATPPRERGL